MRSTSSGSVLFMKDRHGWWVAVGLSIVVNLVLTGFLSLMSQQTGVFHYEPDRVHRVTLVKLPARTLPSMPPQPSDMGSTKHEHFHKTPVSMAVARPAPAPAFPMVPGLSMDNFKPPSIPIATGLARIPGPGDIFGVEALDSPLVAVSRIPPVYPMSAKMRGIEGWVTVRFTVGPDGAVKDLEIVKAEPPGVFDKSVLSCVSRWRFKPGTIMGEPVTVMATTTIRFKLEDRQ
ncbi:MAG: hypothetical protein B5M56_09580 [Desulfococcus sp. 4484_241]|nr:MAG: hypothetical protein B5M56_09580 [Desulfococcus sp. 4484_241]